MVLCKVKGTAKDDEFTSDYIELAIRSIGQNPVSFFKIRGNPTLVPYRSGKFKYKIKADIDLNTPALLLLQEEQI